MKVIIIGAGLTGLTAAWRLSDLGKHRIELIEASDQLGGQAGGFRLPSWDWFLDHTYHHIFTSDHDLLNLVGQINFPEVVFTEPDTSSLYLDEKNYRIIPVNSPQDLLRFPFLTPASRLRVGAVMALLKLSPFLGSYDRITASRFLRQTMGEAGWQMLWQPLFHKKFANHDQSITAAFIWARIKKRTRRLGYVAGGFQALCDWLGERLGARGVLVRRQTRVVGVRRRGGRYWLTCLTPTGKTQVWADAVVSTLPSPVNRLIAAAVFPDDYLRRLSRLRYLSAANLVVSSGQPLFARAYWVNVCVDAMPIMGLIQHTNFVDRKHYGGRHVLYVANYHEPDDPKLKVGRTEALQYFIPHLKKINPRFRPVEPAFYFVSPFAQPLYDLEFVKNRPEMITPAKNFFLANLEMTYPYDRGTNEAVRLGGRVAELVASLG
ncbi:FAD-dependent oxidoreductase [Patescibacteria group bacterium]|nr:FAD-dependent oxidoreductase [Patescibacteria group bacterium]